MNSQMVLLPGYTTDGEKKFRKRAKQLAHAFRQRMKKMKYDLAGYDEAAIIATLAAAVGKPCTYCGIPVKASEVSIDHPDPISRGGEPWKIQGVCKQDNRRKGELKDAEYRRVRAFYATLPQEARTYLYRMLSAGGAFFKLQRAVQGKAAREKSHAGVAPNHQ